MTRVEYMVAAAVLVVLVGGSLSAALFVRTPDRDRPRAYPSEAERWSGIANAPGTGAPLRAAFGAALFYVPGVTVFAGVSSLCLAWMPGRPGTSLGVSALAGAIASMAIARRLLRAGPGAMRPTRPASEPSSDAKAGARPRVLFIGGSHNQTTQMHQIARTLPEVEAWFTPFYSDYWGYRLLLKLGLLERTILGWRRRGACLGYLNAQGLRVDLCAERNRYDLYVSCSDQVIPPGLDGTPWVLVQEGIQEPSNWRTRLWRVLPAIPMPLTGTATFGLSGRYARLCVASEGYRRRYLDEGIAPDRVVTTGIPNFDDFARFRDNAFPHRGYVLVCTSDARETWLAADRGSLLRRAADLAAGRQLIFKLHPNENVERATREIRAAAPEALVFSSGSAEEMVANCEVLFTEWSSLTFCGVALGKEVHTLHSLDEIRDLMPVQNGCAAREIAQVVRGVLETKRAIAPGPALSRATP